MLFLYLFLFLVNRVTSSYYVKHQNKIIVIYNKFSIDPDHFVFFNLISYFDCPNDQCELCIWNSSLIYDVHFYNNKVFSYSINKTLSVNGESLNDAYVKFILKDYPIHCVYISVASFLLCVWYIVFRYNKLLLPIGALLLSTNSMIYYIYPRGWAFFLFDPFCRIFLLTITTKKLFIFGKRKKTLVLRVISQYFAEIEHYSNLNVLSKWIFSDLFTALLVHLYLIIEKIALYVEYLIDCRFTEVYSIKRKYIYSIIYHSTLSLFFLISMIWVRRDQHNPNFSDVRRSICCLYLLLIYLIIIALFYCPLLKFEITEDDIRKELEKMGLLKVKREYLVKRVKQTKFRLTDKEVNEIEISNKDYLYNIIVVFNPMNNISTGTIKF